MIKEKQITVYELYCDKCTEGYSPNSYEGEVVFDDSGRILDAAIDDDWLIGRTKHLCPSCKSLGGAA